MSLRFLTNSTLALLGASLAVFSMAVTAHMAGWIAFGVSVGIIALLGLIQPVRGRGLIQRSLDGFVIAVAAATIVLSLTVTGLTETWFVFGAGALFLGLAYTGLALHEIRTEHVVHSLAPVAERERRVQRNEVAAVSARGRTRTPTAVRSVFVCSGAFIPPRRLHLPRGCESITPPIVQDSRRSPSCGEFQGGRMPASLSPRSLVALTVAFVATVFIFAGVYTATQHKPVPHQVRVGVVGHETLLRLKVALSLPPLQASYFNMIEYKSAGDLKTAIKDRKIYAGFYNQGKSAVLIVAPASGKLLRDNLVMTATNLLSSLKIPLRVVDLVPLEKGDTSGLSSYTYQYGLLVPAFFFGILLFMYASALSLVWRLGLIGGYSIAAGLVGALTVDQVVGALSGHFLALAGLGILYSAMAVLVTYGLAKMMGFAGLALAGLTPDPGREQHRRRLAQPGVPARHLPLSRAGASRTAPSFARCATPSTSTVTTRASR